MEYQKKSDENDIDELSLIPENIIKVEIEDKNEITRIVDSPKRISPKISSPMEISHSPASNVIHLSSTTPPIEPNGSKYCSNCDISFTYSHTFIAHKKFYCKNKPSESSASNASNVVNVTMATETSVQ